jgi:ArsR family transcriptional regulator
MEKNRCCPTDSNMKRIWENELQNELNSLDKTNIREVAALLKILCNPTRLQIVLLLSKKDYCVCELVYLVNEKQNLVSYNLGLLKKHGIVDSYNRSKDKYYKLDSNKNSGNIIKFIKENLITEF